MRIRFAKFSPISSDPRLTYYATGRLNRREGWRAGAARLRGRNGEGVSGSKEGESAVEGTGTWAHVVFSLSEGLSFAVVSDSVLNEARVGFLSHPKTMCRTAPTVVSLPSVYLARSASPCFALSVVLQPLPVFCIRYRIPTTSVPVVFATRFLSGPGCGDRKKYEKRPCECPFKNSYIFL